MAGLEPAKASSIHSSSQVGVEVCHDMTGRRWDRLLDCKWTGAFGATVVESARASRHAPGEKTVASEGNWMFLLEVIAYAVAATHLR